MSEWWLSRGDGKTEGPLSTQALVQGLVAGKIPTHAYVCAAGEQQWALVSQVEEIWEAVDPDGSNTSITERPWFVGVTDSGRHKLTDADGEDERTQLVTPMAQVAPNQESQPSRSSSPRVDARPAVSGKVAEPEARRAASPPAANEHLGPMRAKVPTLDGIAAQPTSQAGASGPPQPGTSPKHQAPPARRSAAKPTGIGSGPQLGALPSLLVAKGEQRPPGSPEQARSPAERQGAPATASSTPTAVGATRPAAVGLMPLGASPQRTTPGVLAPSGANGTFAGLPALSPLQDAAKAACAPSVPLIEQQRIAPAGLRSFRPAPNARHASAAPQTAPPARPTAPAQPLPRQSAPPSKPASPYGSSPLIRNAPPPVPPRVARSAAAPAVPVVAAAASFPHGTVASGAPHALPRGTARRASLPHPPPALPTRLSPTTPPLDVAWDDDAPTKFVSRTPLLQAPPPVVVSATVDVDGPSQQHSIHPSGAIKQVGVPHSGATESPASEPPESGDEATTILRANVAPKPPERSAGSLGVLQTPPQGLIPSSIADCPTNVSHSSPAGEGSLPQESLLSDPSQLLEDIDDEAPSAVPPPVAPIITRNPSSARQAAAPAASPVLASPPSTPPPARRPRLSVPTIVLKPEPIVHQETTQPAVRALRRRSPVRISYGSLLALVLATALIGLAVLFILQRR